MESGDVSQPASEGARHVEYELASHALCGKAQIKDIV